MKKLNLNGEWKFRAAEERGNEWLPAKVPGSVYADLLDNNLMEDPFYRDNEMKALPLMDKDYEYERTFNMSEADVQMFSCELVCEGLDTVAEVALNGTRLFASDNMHVTQRKEIKDLLTQGENKLQIIFRSPTKWISEEAAKRPIEGSTDAMEGFPHLRKAHCMFGWDWGPRLPDAGIWRDIYIELRKVPGRFEDKTHCVTEIDGNGKVKLSFKTSPALNPEDVAITLTAPNGTVQKFSGFELVVENPALWWPRGLGGQPLYTARAELKVNGKTADVWERRIGLRTLDVAQNTDEWGESFAQRCNGVEFFAMGADYIPEDNLLSRMNPERTRRLLEDAAATNMNSIRVWGGGIYPPDYFFDICDELGLVVWQDCMFACAVYDLTPEFDKSIRTEVAQNYNRIRNHASLGIMCANNEIEGMIDAFHPTPKQRGDYTRIFEYIIPETLREQDCNHFFWPSSPSCGGDFDNPGDENRGDVHYWDVWHGLKLFPEYRKFHFRYVSEFGFQSFPSLKTVKTFTLPEDRNIFSYVMEKHQRNGSANGRILSYLSATYLYPGSFGVLLYASQLLQADAIRYGVEHWRRNRGRCMGAVYWQLNDCWPVASWASIDYFGRWKALHYYAKRFFAPVLLSCEEESVITQYESVNVEGFSPKKSVRFNVSNETQSGFEGEIVWSLRNADASVIREGKTRVSVPALSAVWTERMDCNDVDTFNAYCSYSLVKDGALVSSGTVLFCAPKHFAFADPDLSVRLNGDGSSVTVSAKKFARSVEIECVNGDLLLEDNYFDMDAGEREIKILRKALSANENAPRLEARSVFDIR